MNLAEFIHRVDEQFSDKQKWMHYANFWKYVANIYGDLADADIGDEFISATDVDNEPSFAISKQLMQTQLAKQNTPFDVNIDSDLETLKSELNQEYEDKTDMAKMKQAAMEIIQTGSTQIAPIKGFPPMDRMPAKFVEGTRCWKGYERKGFKTMFGKRVPNCVKREDRYLVVDKYNEPVKLFDNEQEAVAYFKENYHLLDSEESPQNILAKYPDAHRQLKQGADLMDFEKLYSELFDYFSATGEMPYGTQKARDGDPYVWIADELDDLGLLDESHHAGLRAWFGKGKKGGAGGGGWDRYNTKGERIGKCGDRKASEGKPKCLSKARAAALRRKGGKAAIAAAVRRKRRKDKNPERKGKAINVSNKPRKKKK